MTGIGDSAFDSLMTDAMELIKDQFADATLVTYIPSKGSSFKIEGIFDEAATVIENDGTVAFETIKPVLSLATADLRGSNRPDPKVGDMVVLRGIKWRISERLPDGRAEIRLVLSKGATRA